MVNTFWATRLCWYCDREKGKELPLDSFTQYPCCGYALCTKCKQAHSEYCLECITKQPESTLEYLDMLQKNIHRPWAKRRLGWFFINGTGTFLDEMDCVPTYHHIVERSNLLCMLNPSNAAMGVNWIKQAAAQGDVAAMIQLGDIHLITFHGDNSVTPSLEKAEKFYCEAYTTTEHPIASFRYAKFLDSCSMKPIVAFQCFNFAATRDHTEAHFMSATYLLDAKGRRFPWNTFGWQGATEKELLKGIGMAL